MRQPAVDIIATLAGIAQLVERNLAKVEVASSRLVSRSRLQGKARFGVNAGLPFFISTQGGMAEWSCSGLQSRGRRFDSDSRLQINTPTRSKSSPAGVFSLGESLTALSIPSRCIP